MLESLIGLAILIADVCSIYLRDVVPEHANPAATGRVFVQLLEWWGDKALEDVNGRSCRDYVAWREELREKAIANGRLHPDFPHYNSIRRRFGGWPQALQAAGFDHRLDRRNPPDWWTPLKTESPPWG